MSVRPPEGDFPTTSVLRLGYTPPGNVAAGPTDGFCLFLNGLCFSAAPATHTEPLVLPVTPQDHIHDPQL